MPDPIPSTRADYVRGEPVKLLGEEAIAADYVSTGRYGGSTLQVARLDPSNRTGTGGEDLFSGNYNWTLPLLSLPGRAGLDLGLSLAYNSLVWTKLSSTNMFWDEDRGFPSPGFRLGFPVVQPRFYNEVAGQYAYLLVTPSGARVELRQLASSNVYEAPDSSYLQLIDNGATKLLRDTNGTQFSFTDNGTGHYHCVQIKDRNGNYLSVAYQAGRISTVTDTLQRVIRFNYDANNRLSTITQTRGGSEYRWATFGYSPVTVTPNFPGMWVYGPYNQTLSLLTQVWTTNSLRYDFDYTPFGQVYAVSRTAPAGNLLSRRSYNLPATQAQSDCPRFTERRDWVAEWNGDDGATFSTLEESVTSFGAEPSDAQTITLPDRTTVMKEFFHTGGWQRGLTYRTETWSNGALKKWATFNWAQDNVGLGYRLNPRVTETNIYDAEGSRRRRSTVEYHASFGLPRVVTEYAADATTVIRRSSFDYKMDAAYVDRRIIGLLFRRADYDAGWRLLTKTEYWYDWAGELFVDTAAPATQHDRVNYGPGFVTGRGNLQNILRYDVNDPDNLNDTRTETKFRYNSTGSVVASRDHHWHESAYHYADGFSDGVSRNTFAYPTRVTDPYGHASATQYDYHTGAVTRTEDPKGAVRVMSYDAVGRLEKVLTPFNGAYTQWAYPSTFGYVQNFSTVNGAVAESYTNRVLDGLGRVISAATNHPNSVGGYKAQHRVLDVMGRLVEQTNPTEIDSGWTASGDDAMGWRTTRQTYDWQGRPLVTTNVDSTTREITYEGCGCAGSQVVTTKDEVGRRQRQSYDVLGRLWKTETLNYDGSVYRTTTNTYNALDQATQIDDRVGTGGPVQVTVMGYDGHGRLQSRKFPHETVASIFQYESDDTLKSVTDARGARTNYRYDARHLLTGITYDPPAGVTDTPDVTFGYDAAGNRTSMTDGLGSASYSFDTLSRMTSETRTINGVGTFGLTYSYNRGGLLTGINDHFGSQVGYTYDSAGRVSGVTGAGYAGVTSYASAVRYRAWQALSSLSYGNGRPLNVSYNSRMLPTRYEVPGVLAAEYQYYDDARLSFMHDLTQATSPFDRRYSYDHVGRLTEALTGSEARGGSAADGPFRQSYTYDVWDNLTGRTGRHWSTIIDGFTHNYTNYRNDLWAYDAAGHATREDNLQHTYDAAGRLTRTTRPRTQATSGLNITRDYDGDGRRLRQGSTYYLRSSVVGKVITEVAASAWDGSWIKRRGFVYLSGEVLATHDNGMYGNSPRVAWLHSAPHIGSQRGTASDGGETGYATELDPAGVDAGLEDPYLGGEGAPGGTGGNESDLIFPLYGDMLNLSSGCAIDGSPVSCDSIANSPDDSMIQLPPGAGTIDLTVDYNTGNLLVRNSDLVIDGSGVIYKREKVKDPDRKKVVGPSSGGKDENGEPIEYIWKNVDDEAWHWEYTMVGVSAGDSASFVDSKADCSIEVRFKGNLSPETPEFSDGPDTRRLGPYVSEGVYGLRFEVKGHVSSGGIGFVGAVDYEPDKAVQGFLDNGGIWTIGQNVISTDVYAQYKGMKPITKTSHPLQDNPRPEGRNISGNTFAWHDSPGFLKSSTGDERGRLLSARNRTAFHVFVTDGERTCSISFQITESFRRGVWSASIKRL